MSVRCVTSRRKFRRLARSHAATTVALEQLEPRRALSATTVTHTNDVPVLLPQIQVSHFGQDIPFVNGPLEGVTLTGREKFQQWGG